MKEAKEAYDRCRCRPGCLARITVDDDVALTDVGYALTEHVSEAYPQEPLFDASELAS